MCVCACMHACMCVCVCVHLVRHDPHISMHATHAHTYQTYSCWIWSPACKCVPVRCSKVTQESHRANHEDKVGRMMVRDTIQYKSEVGVSYVYVSYLPVVREIWPQQICVRVPVQGETIQLHKLKTTYTHTYIQSSH